MSRNLIEFHCGDPGYFPHPFPASRAVPQWLKDMPTDRPLNVQLPEGPRTVDVPSVKQCPPFIDVMTCGYMIPLAGDVEFEMDAAGALNFSSQGKIIDTQHPLQTKGSPLQGKIIVKFLNPWVVKTPPGYSCLFLHPANQFQYPFLALGGLVETDTYYRPVHFPTICLMERGTKLSLKRGTPIAQVIPIRREDWESRSAPWDDAARQQIEQEMAANRFNFYKDRFWKKKSYT